MPYSNRLLVALACLGFALPLGAEATELWLLSQSSQPQTAEPIVLSVGTEPIVLTGSLTADSPKLQDNSHYSIHRFSAQAN